MQAEKPCAGMRNDVMERLELGVREVVPRVADDSGGILMSRSARRLPDVRREGKRQHVDEGGRRGRRALMKVGELAGPDTAGDFCKCGLVCNTRHQGLYATR